MKTKIRISFLLIVLPIMIFRPQFFLDFMSWLSGTRTNAFILSDTPLTLSPNPIQLYTAGEAEITGELSSVCLSLGGNYNLDSTSELNAEFKKIIDGADIKATIQTSSGRTITLDAPTMSWSLYGNVAANDELSACMHLKRSVHNLPEQTKISYVGISSSKEVEVQGIYWKSANSRN